MRLISKEVSCDEVEASLREEYGEDVVAECIEELLPCGCGSTYLDIHLEKHQLPDGGYIGYVAECQACGMRTRQTESPFEAQAVWNTAFRNNAEALDEILEIRERLDRIEGKG